MYFCTTHRRPGIDSLCAMLGAERVRFDGATFWQKSRRVHVCEHTPIVNWDGGVPDLMNLRVLNPRNSPLSRYDKIRLICGDVRCVRMYPRQPLDGIPRAEDSVGAWDILGARPFRPACWTIKESFTDEYVVHVFNDKVLKSGRKVQIDDVAHPWVRIESQGWGVDYAIPATATMLSTARTALSAINATLGMVTIGKHSNGTLFVIDASITPTLDATTTPAYAEMITAWAQGKVIPAVPRKELDPPREARVLEDDDPPFDDEDNDGDEE